MDNSLNNLILSAKHILIVLSTKPFFDQVAAALSLHLSLSGKSDMEVYCPAPMSVDFNRLVGVNKVKSEIGNKNLKIKIKNYDANNIEKVSYDIENGEFNLTIIPKVGFVAPQKEQLDLNYSGITADLIILIGGANDTHFPILDSKEIVGAKFIHIGTRALTSTHEVMSFAKPGASASELVASLIKENNFEMHPDIATNLVMGIEDGSNHFESPEVTPDTFEIFAYLLRSGGQRQLKTVLSPTNFPPGSIPTQPFIQEKVENKEELVESPPDDWLQPKIFKGTSVS